MWWSSWLPVVLMAAAGWPSTVTPPYVGAGPTASASVDYVNPQTDKCLKAASGNPRPIVSIAIGTMSRAGRVVKVSLSIYNSTSSPIWMNLRPDTLGGGLPSEQQVFVTIHAPRSVDGYSMSYDTKEPPRADDYGVIAPHKRYQLTAVVDARPLDLRPGNYRVDACFWDRTPTIPKPPKGAMIVRGPIAVSAVVPVPP